MKRIQTLLMTMLSIAFAANAQTVRVPDVKEFKTTEECNRYTSTANTCAEYYLTHTLDEPNVQEAGNFVYMWTNSTDKLMLNIGEPAHTGFIECIPALIAYMSASVIYATTHNQKQPDGQAHEYAMRRALDFYKRNKSLLGTVPRLETYLKAQADGTFSMTVKREFNELAATIANPNTPKTTLK